MDGGGRIIKFWGLGILDAKSKTKHKKKIGKNGYGNANHLAVGNILYNLFS